MVSAAGIAEGLRTLAAGGVRPRLLIIDDGWQQTDVDEQYRQMGGWVAVLQVQCRFGGRLHCTANHCNAPGSLGKLPACMHAQLDRSLCA